MHVVSFEPGTLAATPDGTPALRVLATAAERLAEATTGELDAALDGLVAAARDAGVSALRLAALPSDPEEHGAAKRAGCLLDRELLQLRRPLPLTPPPVPGVTVRTFDERVDLERWLAVNNRAFAWHPEQGDWTRQRFAATAAEPWYDPAGFLVHDGSDGKLDSFCWTKVHPAAPGREAMGEIFVVAVDPAQHGHGLGRALVVAGLDHLTARGLTTAMLYVEATNTPACVVYEQLGFTVHERHCWWECPVDEVSP